MNYDQTVDGFFQVLKKQYPKNKKGHHYVTLHNGRKCFFNIFHKKYGLDGSKVKYHKQDVIRRIRFIEIIDLFVKSHSLFFDHTNKYGENVYVIESIFFKMIIVDVRKHHAQQMELLSFFPK